MKHLAPLTVGVFLLLGSTLLAQSESMPKKPQQLPQTQPQQPDRRVLDLEREVAGLKREVAALKMPAAPALVSLCDKPIPLFDEDIREDFEREFYQFLEHKGLLTILVKRYGKFFAIVSDEIERMSMPPDLIYLAIAESYLNPRAKSAANAGGMWQFVKDTGKRHGLFINDDIDERYSVTRSTRSALIYLKKLDDEFGDWFVAMAAYNCGENRVREAIANQNTRSFFELFLPEETDRYIYRIAAIKEILGNPQKYGLPLETSEYYRPYSVTEVTVDVDRETHTLILAQAMELPYKAFREYNLHIRKYKLPRGTYHIYVPVEKKETFLKSIKACPGITLQKEG
jgi:membrane-bound lytic murein transglycosylase D